MRKSTYKFTHSSTDYYLESNIRELKKITNPKSTVLITDQHVFDAHTQRLKGWNMIVLKPGEENKVQTTVEAVIDELVQMECDRTFTLVGIGGGVVTDMTGYVASIYMRGLRFGFVPTSVLALVDASIGGKNGIDLGVYKNMIGVIRQPAFILHDITFLKTLPISEWENGFAEIVKHASIRDAAMFAELENVSLQDYMRNK